MPRPVACPHCGEELDIPPEYRGQEVRCAGCQNVFTPPADRGGPAASAPWGRDDDDLPSRRDRRRSDLDDRPPARSDEDRAYRDEDDFAPRRRRRPRKSASLLWLWILLGAGFLFCVVPCGGFMVWAVMLEFPEFEPIESKEGRFRASFPGTPSEFSTRTDRGLQKHCWEFRRGFPTEKYFVHYVDLPRVNEQERDRVLQDAADRFLADEPGGQERERFSRTHGGHPALFATIEHADGVGTTVVRYILVDRRLYTIGISCEQGIEGNEPRAQTFFDEFIVTSEGSTQK